MTRHELRKVFDRLDWWLKHDKCVQDSFDKFNKAIAPNSYVPSTVERSGANGFIEGVCSSSQTAWLKEHLSYYAYELPGMKQATGEIKNKKYNLKKKSEYIDFVLNNI